MEHRNHHYKHHRAVQKLSDEDVEEEFMRTIWDIEAHEATRTVADRFCAEKVLADE